MPNKTQNNESSEIILSSRIRLARNINGFPFPEWASSSDLAQIRSISKKALAATSKPLKYVELKKIKDIKKNILVEQDLLSSDFISGDNANKSFASNGKDISLMINEEDHLRISIQKPDFQLEECWRQLDALDTVLSSQIEFAFNNKIGFATACPSNVGTGMRVSVMMHLPALCLEGKIGDLVANLNENQITVRGLFGEGSLALGHVFQISNLSTLGVSELETISYIKKVASSLFKKELISRKNLLKNDRAGLEDKVKRSIGILKYATLISHEEALDHLSLIILGQNLGLEKELKPLKNLAEMSKQLRDAHLRKQVGSKILKKPLDAYRAQQIRKIIG